MTDAKSARHSDKLFDSIQTPWRQSVPVCTCKHIEEGVVLLWSFLSAHFNVGEIVDAWL